MTDKITIAILAKQKAHSLPLCLKCIKDQTYPKHLISLYIRANNSTDSTNEVIKEWLDENRSSYAEIYENYENVDEKIELLGQHEWTPIRFIILGNIRKKSLEWAYSRNSNYFVVDCDNFIIPSTIESLFLTNLPIVGPLLHSKNAYSNFHETCDSNGYMAQGQDAYFILLNQKVKKLVSVDVIHCTYFIRHDVLPKLEYIDGSGRHEYVIFSHSARKNNILQFLDTRVSYGHTSFAINTQELLEEPWYAEFTKESTLIISPQAGFGNRMRALASGLAIAKRTKRTPYMMWKNYSGQINLKTFDKYFEPIPGCEFATPEKIPTVDLVLSEWKNCHSWWHQQNGAQIMWPECKNVIQVDEVFPSNGGVNILLETSKRLDVSDVDMMESYQTNFKPQKRFLDVINGIENLDVILSIRRGNLLQYFPQANQSSFDITTWILKVIPQGSKICIFSDDWKFRDEIKSAIEEFVVIIEPDFSAFAEKYEIAFCEFLLMSYKCDKLYGTPCSSFAAESGLFGQKNHYSEILS